MKRFLSFLWRRIGGRAQWRILWLMHAKFSIGVSGVVLNPNNEVLLLDHVFRNERHWSLPSGWLNANESAEAGLIREVREETGIPIQVEGLLSMRSGYVLRLEAIYRARTDATEIPFVSNELYAARFFPVDSLPSSVPSEHRGYILDAHEARVSKSLTGRRR